MKDKIINSTLFIDNEIILTKLISDITDIPYKKLHNNVELLINNNTIKKNTKKKDYIVTFNNHHQLILDINKEKYQGLKTNNYSYFLNIYSKNTIEYNIFNQNYMIIQINFNTFSNKNSNYIDVFELKNNNGDKYIENFKIYTLDIVKCHKIYYQNNKNINKKIIWGTLLYSKKNDPNIKKIMKSILNKDEIKRLFTKK